MFHVYSIKIDRNIVDSLEYDVLLSLCKQTIDYLDGKISLAHARCTHLSQVIKSQNKTIYTVVNVSNIYIH